MCLIPDKEKTEKFMKEKGSQKSVVIWKWVRKVKGKYYSPYRITPINNRVLKAIRPQKPQRLLKHTRTLHVNGGCIHAFINKKEAISRKPYTPYPQTQLMLIRCTADPKDMVALSGDHHKHIAFTKIKFPKSLGLQE